MEQPLVSAQPFTWGHAEVPAWAGVKTMARSMQRQGSVLMSMVHIPTTEHRDAPGPGSHREPHSCRGTVHNWPHSSLSVALWKAGPILHLWQHLGEQALSLA